MRDFLTLGPVPVDEECQQVGTDNYDAEKAMVELHAYKGQLERQFIKPNETPFSICFGIKAFPHDFGTYREVVVFFDDKDEDAVHYAIYVEDNIPLNWDAKARQSLGAT